MIKVISVHSCVTYKKAALVYINKTKELPAPSADY